MNRTAVISAPIAFLLLAVALAGCMAGPPNTPEANRTQEKAMTGQTE
jgi:hypothetical protein